MSIIGWIMLDLVAGLIASKIVNNSGQRVFLDITLGINGALAGGFLFSFLGAVPSPASMSTRRLSIGIIAVGLTTEQCRHQ